MVAEDAERGAQALGQLRAATVDICDVIPLTADEDFHVTTVTKLTGNALLVDSSVTALEYHRTPAHIARGGLDHYHITLCLNGKMWFGAGRRDMTLWPGDVGLVDMAAPNRTVLTNAAGGRARLMSLILPRAMLAPRLAHPDSAMAVLQASHPHARLLADRFDALWRTAEPEADSAEATIGAIADLIAVAAGCTADTERGVEGAERHLYLAMIKRHIAGHLESPALTVQELCERFQISRASLYRLFEADGGFAHYVQEQRLNRALMLLVAPATQGKRLIDLAIELQFSSDSTFVRAFRQKFGLTPGEIRKRAEAWVRETGTAPTTDNLLHQLTRR